MKVRIKKLDPAAITPKYATDGSGCFDIHSLTEGRVQPKAPLSCRTGLSFEIPAKHVMLVFSRSGHGFKNDVHLSNCVGVIDSDYRGELGVKLTADEAIGGTNGMTVNIGDRIAQAAIIPVDQVEFVEVDELSETARGTGGFGSTGNQ